MPTVKGAFAVPVVRFFEEECYAIDFAESGNARFKALELFRVAEGVRQDDSEGVGRLATGTVPFVRMGDNPVQAALEVVTKNPAYVLCFSDAAADLPRLAEQFGRYMVRIEDPNVLNTALREITFAALPTDRKIAVVRLAQVEYDKGAVRAVPNLPSAMPLAFFQKPEPFAHEKEWRIAVVLSGEKAGAPDHLDATIPIAQKLEIQRL